MARLEAISKRFDPAHRFIPFSAENLTQYLPKLNSWGLDQMAEALDKPLRVLSFGKPMGDFTSAVELFYSNYLDGSWRWL